MIFTSISKAFFRRSFSGHMKSAKNFTDLNIYDFFMWDKHLEIYISGMKITLAFSRLIDGDLRNRNIP